jgi:hypothetical protein
MLTEAKSPARGAPERTTASPRRRGAAWLVAAALAAAGVAAYRQVLPPPAAGADAPAGAFSAARAMRDEVAIARAPRPTGSAENARVRAYLVARLTSLGLSPRVQTATAVSTVYPSAGTVRNIVARLRGSRPGGRAVMLVAHYDGVAAGPGASDDASGVAALLETVRALKAGPALRNDVVVLLTDGEEDGLLGAAAFAGLHPWMRGVGVVVNFEARGAGGPSLMFETGARNAAVVRALAGAPRPVASSLFFALYRMLRNDTDVSELKHAGAQALNFAFVGHSEAYHTPLDTPGREDIRSLQHHGGNALAVTRALGNEDLPPRADGDAVFFSAAGVLVSYPQSWALLLALVGGALLMAVAVAGVRRREISGRGMAAGAGAVLGATVVASIAGALLLWVLGAVHHAIGGDPQWSGAYLVAAAALSLGISLAAWRLALRRWNAASLLAGSSLVWLALALVTAALLPGASYLFLWPLAPAIVALAVAVGAKDGSARRPVTLAVGVAAAIPALFLLVPLFALLHLLGGTTVAVVVVFSLLGALAVGVMSIPVSAVLDELPVAAPVGVLAVCLASVAVGMATERRDADHPRIANLVFAANADARAAATVLYTDAPGAWGAALVDAKERPLPEAIGAVIGAGPAYFRGAAMPALEAPSASVVADSVVDGARVLRLDVGVPPTARTLELFVPGPLPQEASVNGEPVITSGYRIPLRGGWSLNYFNPEVGVVHVRLKTRLAPLTLKANAVWSGVPAEAGLAKHPRPADVVPFGPGDRTVVGRRFTFPLPAAQ